VLGATEPESRVQRPDYSTEQYCSIYKKPQCFDAVGWAAERGIRPVKTEWWSTGVVICLEIGADLRMAQLMPLGLTVSCFSKIQTGLPFWYRLALVVPEKGPLNGCVRACVTRSHSNDNEQVASPRAAASRVTLSTSTAGYVREYHNIPFRICPFPWQNPRPHLIRSSLDTRALSNKQ